MVERIAPVRVAAEVPEQRGEEQWLGELSADERRVFLKVLQRLAPTPD